MHRRSRLLLFVLCLLVPLAACGDKKDKDKEKPPETVEKLYNDAWAKLQEKEYKEAIKGFEEVERQHPYSEWATRAEVMGAYANYKSENYTDAVGSLERFVKQHPGSRDTPYAYYLRSMCYYEQIVDVGRDQKVTDQARQALVEVIKRFPDTPYARDAKIKLDLVIDHLAGKEMEIGRYYERHLDYLAAINRFRTVVEKYQTTSHSPEALHRLVECYLRLGVVDQAKRYAAVLGYNYPGSTWYKDSYALMNGGALPPEPEAQGGWHKLMPF
jgi:outer membrane protein assembly factor BamD